MGWGHINKSVPDKHFKVDTVQVLVRGIARPGIGVVAHITTWKKHFITCHLMIRRRNILGMQRGIRKG